MRVLKKIILDDDVIDEWVEYTEGYYTQIRERGEYISPSLQSISETINAMRQALNDLFNVS